MLFHYLIADAERHDYEFLNYDDLKDKFADNKIVGVFKTYIDLIPLPKTNGGKRRKSRRRKNTQKLMKNRQPLSSRKNNQA